MANKKGVPTLPNITELIQAGINPVTGLPTKFTGSNCDGLKPGIKQALRIVDEQDAINRYTWYNLPLDMSSQELERLLYYRGRLCMFYDKDTEEFYIMPFALEGGIDFYGRELKLHPVPYAEQSLSDSDEDKKRLSRFRSLLSTMSKTIRYGVIAESIEDEEGKVNEDILYDSAVIIQDYSNQTSNSVVPRASVVEPLLDLLSDIPCYLNTALLASTGITGMRVNDADAASEVKEASRKIKQAALNGDLFTAMVSAVEFQELTGGNSLKATEFLLAMQSLDNLRLRTLGIQNGGLFEKKAHELNSEATINSNSSNTILDDGLARRQNFCNIVNSIWDLDIWCDLSESIAEGDLNGDGVDYNENLEGENSGIEGGSGDGDIK